MNEESQVEWLELMDGFISYVGNLSVLDVVGLTRAVEQLQKERAREVKMSE